MAQILKFQQGGQQNKKQNGTLVYKGVTFDITEDLIRNYDIAASGWEEDSHMMDFYNNNFRSKLEQGKNDPNVRIEIGNDTITGISLEGYTPRQSKRLHKDPTTGGQFIESVFNPKVEGARKAIHMLTKTVPGKKEEVRVFHLDTPITLNHKFDNNGEIIYEDGKRKLTEGQNSKIKLIEERINFAKNKNNLQISDNIIGYNDITKAEFLDIVKEIPDLDEFKQRLINGDYTEQDETWAKAFGILMDTDTSSERESLKSIALQKEKYSKAGMDFESWGNFGTVNDFDVFVLSDRNSIPEISGYSNVFLNSDFFEKYPQYSYLRHSDKGYFIIGNNVYNADNLDQLPENVKSYIKAWVKHKKQNFGNSNNMIFDDWYGNRHYQWLNEDYYYPSLGEYKLFGVDLMPFYDSNFPIFGFFNQDDEDSYDEFGDPKLSYWYNNDISDQLNAKRRQTTDETKKSLDIWNDEKHAYKDVDGQNVAYTGDDILNINGKEFKVPIYYNRDTNTYFTSLSDYMIILKRNNKTWEIISSAAFDGITNKLLKIHKKGGKITKFHEGGPIYGSFYNKPFPVDNILSLIQYGKANIDSTRSNNILKNALTKATYQGLPVDTPELYPIYNENGLSSEVQLAKDKIRSASLKPSTSDHIANLNFNLERDAVATNFDLNEAKTRSEYSGKYKESLMNSQAEYSKSRTDNENKRRQMQSALTSNEGQLDSSLVGKIGYNLQKYLKEFRDQWNAETIRRNEYLHYALRANSSAKYHNELATEFQKLGGWSNVSPELAEKYNNDFMKYMEGEHPYIASSIKGHIDREIWSYQMNDPNASNVSWLRRKWSYPWETGITNIPIPTKVDTPLTELEPSTYKNGGKLEYIETLNLVKVQEKDDLIKFFSNLYEN